MHLSRLLRGAYITHTACTSIHYTLSRASFQSKKRWHFLLFSTLRTRARVSEDGRFSFFFLNIYARYVDFSISFGRRYRKYYRRVKVPGQKTSGREKQSARVIESYALGECVSERAWCVSIYLLEVSRGCRKKSLLKSIGGCQFVEMCYVTVVIRNRKFLNTRKY